MTGDLTASTAAPGCGVSLVDRTISIGAPPSRVYALLTDATELMRWLAPEADVDARPGGVITWRHANGDRVAGHFVELVPDRRIVFTYGWDRPDVGIPPGTTRVEITLTPTATSTGTGTDLHLVHRGLSDPMAHAHTGGWANYLGRLAVVAEGGHPGSDPLAGERVPSASPATAVDVSADTFEDLAARWLRRDGVTRSTMMGLPCLRRDGAFFAALDRTTADLLIKLDEATVTALVDDGRARPFAPAGRRFRQWAAVPTDLAASWPDLLEQAYRRAGGTDPTRHRPDTRRPGPARGQAGQGGLLVEQAPAAGSVAVADGEHEQCGDATGVGGRDKGHGRDFRAPGLERLDG